MQIKCKIKEKYLNWCQNFGNVMKISWDTGTTSGFFGTESHKNDAALLHSCMICIVQCCIKINFVLINFIFSYNIIYMTLTYWLPLTAMGVCFLQVTLYTL
jgi:hypothetical protein